MNFKVYLIRNKIKDVIYVGLTRQSLARRFIQHVSKRQWSAAEFAIELVEDFLTQDQAVTLEEMLIQQYNTREIGYNVSPKSINGYSNYHSDEMKARWSSERRGKPVSEEHAAKNRVARLGRTNSDYHKQMVSLKKSKAVICLNDGISYPSARKAAKAYDVSYCRISDVCNGKRKNTKGYRFKFI